MPPKQRFSKQDIIDAGFKILRENGAEFINARAICNKLNCSTQPIFSQFENMSELKEVLVEKAREVYNECVKEALASDDTPFKASCIAYIRFAKNDMHLFSLLFMNEKSEKIGEFKMNTDEESHFHLWIYAHGIATLIATKSIQFTDEQIAEMVNRAYTSTLI